MYACGPALPTLAFGSQKARSGMPGQGLIGTGTAAPRHAHAHIHRHAGTDLQELIQNILKVRQLAGARRGLRGAHRAPPATQCYAPFDI
jgi:hypothetical protein